ncbi:MAG: DUF3298 domain-containing protein [Peptostreptococcaceae bacterium]
MNNKEKIKSLKDNYMDIEIPDRLDTVVNEALEGKSKINKNKIKRYKNLSLVAASILIFVGAINFSTGFADALEKVPVIGTLVKVIRFSNYSFNENGFNISLDVPKITGLNNKKLENEINDEIDKEAKKQYDNYIKEMKELKNMDVEGRDLAESWYEVKTDNEDILSLIVYYFHAQGSSNTTRKCYNIDKKNETALTLKSIFKDEDYINIISENIKQQMKQQMKDDPNKVYWVESDTPDMDFKKITSEQQFYINENDEIVICFDKYEVAPGYMGIVDFTIPKDILDPLKNK